MCIYAASVAKKQKHIKFKNLTAYYHQVKIEIIISINVICFRT